MMMEVSRPPEYASTIFLGNAFSLELRPKLIEQRQQNRFLHVQAIFGLFENDGARRIHDGFADFRAAVSRKTVHEDRVGRGMGEERVIDLIAGECSFAR